MTTGGDLLGVEALAVIAVDIVDRLTFAGQIVETGTLMHRLTQARRRPARAESH